MLKNSQRIVFLIVIFVMVTFQSVCSAAELVTINQLIENAGDFDQTVVTIQGELIGEALERGEYAWININDQTNAIGIYVKIDELNQFRYYGDYKNIGDTVRITGVFHNACSEHGGDVDIHCDTIEQVIQGHSLTEQISTGKIAAALILFTIMLLVLAVYVRVIKWKTVKDTIKPDQSEKSS